jgi:hypothetical protein
MAPGMEVFMEYKLSSFQFSNDLGREDKNQVIKKINSIRSRCPSDASFTGCFSIENKVFKGEIKVLFSKGSFFTSKTASNMEELLKIMINSIDDQITVWKEVRFDQPKTFIDYSEWLSNSGATGS